MDTREVLKKLF